MIGNHDSSIEHSTQHAGWVNHLRTKKRRDQVVNNTQRSPLRRSDSGSISSPPRPLRASFTSNKEAAIHASYDTMRAADLFAGEKGRVLDSQPKPLGVVGHQSGFGKLGGPCVIHAGEVVRLIACIVALLVDGVERCPVRKRVCGPVLAGLATCCRVGRGGMR